MPDLTTLILLFVVCLLMFFRELNSEKGIKTMDYFEIYKFFKLSVALIIAVIILLVLIVHEISKKL